MGKRPLEVIQEGGEEDEQYSGSDLKDSNRNSKKRSRKRKRRSGSEPNVQFSSKVIPDEERTKRRKSLVITVDGSGSKTVLDGPRPDHFDGRRQDYFDGQRHDHLNSRRLDRLDSQRRDRLDGRRSDHFDGQRRDYSSSSLHNSLRSPHQNHIHNRIKPLPLLPTPPPIPRGPGDFPREPHTDTHHPPPLNRLTDLRRYSLDSAQVGYERGAWHHHTPSSLPSRMQGEFSRSLSSGESHLPPGPPPLQRRFSEQLEHHPRSYDTTPHQHNPRHAPPDHMTPYREGGGASRGFRMSDEGARHAGYYHERSNRSPTGNRRFGHGQFRH